MSTRDFEYKQIAFVFTGKGEKISFKNDVTIQHLESKTKSRCFYKS